MDSINTTDNHYSMIGDKYPIHLPVWENNIKHLTKAVKNHKNELEKVDPHGRSPLQLAVILNHFECVKILLENGANVLDSLNKDGWSIIHEATSVGNEEMLRLLLQYRYYQRYVKEMKSIPEILKAIHEAPDFYFEMKWEFSSLIPLLSKFCPSDTCKVWKSGPNVRIDTTLIDFQEQGANRGPRSYLFHGTGAEAKFIEIDHEKKRISSEVYEVGVPMETIELELMKPYPAHVRERLSNPIMTTYLDVDNISFERNKSGIWGWRSDKTENVHGYECSVYNASNVELVTKTRIEHLTNGARKDLIDAQSDSTTNSSGSAYSNGFENPKLLPSIPLVNTLFGFKTVSDNTHDDPRMHLRTKDENEPPEDHDSITVNERRLSAPEKLKCNTTTTSLKGKLLSRSSNFNILEGLKTGSPKLGNSTNSNANSLVSSLGKKFKSKKGATESPKCQAGQRGKSVGPGQSATTAPNKCNINDTTCDSKSSDSSESDGAFDSASSGDLSFGKSGPQTDSQANKGTQNAVPHATYNPSQISLEQYFFPVRGLSEPGITTIIAGSQTSQNDKEDRGLQGEGAVVSLGPPRSPTPNSQNIGRLKKEVISKSQKFKATLWLSEECPFPYNTNPAKATPDMILPIIDLMPKSNAHFSKLKEFITLQLPPGFPVKIEIPIFHIFNARVTFANICAKDEEISGVCKLLDDKTGKLSCIIDSSVFEIPKGYSGYFHEPLYSLPSTLNATNFIMDNDDKYTSEDESLLQYAIQQSLIDLGTENDKVTVWEALKKGQPQNGHTHTKEDSASFYSTIESIEVAAATNSTDDDLAKALKLSEKETLERQRLESAQAAQLEEILKLSLIEK